MAKGDQKQVQQQGQAAQDRYYAQQGPAVNNMAMNYGRATETNYGDYNDIMNRYRNIAPGGSNAGGGGGYGTVGTTGITAQKLNPLERVQAQKSSPFERVQASNPFNSYAGYQEFSNTGGYSGQDIADLRARGTSPVRAAYANAERNIGQQRALQGGYSPNAIAAQVRMAREQGQGMADAMQNVDAGIVDMRNQGKLAGLGGMSKIESDRLAAQMQGDIYNSGAAMNQNQFDIGNQLQGDIFNSGQAFQGNQFDISNQLNADQFNAQQGLQAGMFNAGQGNAYSSDQTRNQLAALQGMTSLYGTTPGMSDMFGNQLINTMGQGANYDLGMMGRQTDAAKLPSSFQQGIGNAQAIAGMAGGAMSAWDDYQRNRNRTQNGGTTQVDSQGRPIVNG